jgi:hypothetical protein
MPLLAKNRGINKESYSPTTIVTGSLLQKPVTLASVNLGSCDKKPGQADTTIDTAGAIFQKKEAAQSGLLQEVTAQKAVGVPIRAASGWPRGNTTKIEKIETFCSTRSIYLAQN